MLRYAGRLILTTLTAAMLAGPVTAAEGSAPDSTAIPAGVPEMNGHRFAPTPLVKGPFIQTFLRNSLGMASASDVSTPPIIINGNEIAGLVGDLKAALLVFEYQLALKRWLAIRGQIGIGGRFGTGVQTLLAEGVATSVDFEFGWIFSLYESERTRLSGALDISNRSVNSVSVYNLVSDIVEGTSYGLSHSTPVLSGSGGLQFAWAASPLVGVTANALVGNGDSLDRTKDSVFFYRVGLALSFDLDRYGMPLSVALSVAGDDRKAEANDEGGAIWETGVRFSYIGRDAFLISLDLSRARIPTSEYLEAFNGTWMGMSLTYYF